MIHIDRRLLKIKPKRKVSKNAKTGKLRKRFRIDLWDELVESTVSHHRENYQICG